MTTWMQEWEQEHAHETPEQQEASWANTVRNYREETGRFIRESISAEIITAMNESRRIDPTEGMTSEEHANWIMGIEP